MESLVNIEYIHIWSVDDTKKNQLYKARYIYDGEKTQL